MKKKATKFSKTLTSRPHSSLSRKAEKALGYLTNRPDKALQLVNELIISDKGDPLLWIILTKAQLKLGNFLEAEKSANEALALTPHSVDAIHVKTDLLFNTERYEEAVSLLTDSIEQLSEEIALPLLEYLSLIYSKQKKYEMAEVVCRRLIKLQPDNWRNWNNIGLINMDFSRFEDMDKALLTSMSLSGNNAVPYYNRIVGAHYNPESTAEKILEMCRDWQSKFAVKHVSRAVAKNKHKNKRLRIGLVSDGFCSHPVGNMITLGLSNIPKSDIEFYAYSTNLKDDHVTQRIKRFCSKWQVVESISEDRLNQIIRQDNIDILFDLCGYNSNSRMRTFQLAPAPLQVKWVGGLISSTGIDTIDYLLSDSVETPEDSDLLYTEKLIRMPNDYICYDPPFYLPNINESPLKNNGYITFGCFNNASKINDVLLKYWIRILHEVPDSRLFLKSFNFDNSVLREEIYSRIEGLGISRNRVRIEGKSIHEKLLSCYNDVDIALDPWPYSGGLTTCEAMAMGVPVVTLPGPTFAGRHSASHLVNAGMKELVALNWEQYVNIAVGLARDVNSLDVIRRHLRQILLASPVCDGDKFGQHFSDAMRAIWQRHCENKTPEALTLSNDSSPYFHDDNHPIDLQRPVKSNVENEFLDHDVNFNFHLNGKVVMMDYGARFTRGRDFILLDSMDAFYSIVMDLTASVEDNELPIRRQSCQHIKMHALCGEGTVQVNLCLDKNLSSDLKPLIDHEENQIVAKINAQSSALDNFSGLNKLDWLILDNKFDLESLFTNAATMLSQCLVIDVRISFEQTHVNQMSFDAINNLLHNYGFSIHSYQDIEYKSCDISADSVYQNHDQFSKANVLFVLNENNLKALDNERREKLAFVMHFVYKKHAIAHSVLRMNADGRADEFIAALSPDERKSVHEAVSKNHTYFIPEMPRMSFAETLMFEKYVKKANSYYEFGSGGSTKLATRHQVTVYGVESDKRWVDTLRKEAGPLCKVDYVDIGPTKEWGYPVSDAHHEKFPLYSESILGFRNVFDFILVDGRFRVACTLNAIKHTLDMQAPVDNTFIFIHDFWDRTDYHIVLDFLDVQEIAETAGVFKLKEHINRDMLAIRIEEYKFVTA